MWLYYIILLLASLNDLSPQVMTVEWCKCGKEVTAGGRAGVIRKCYFQPKKEISETFLEQKTVSEVWQHLLSVSFV